MDDCECLSGADESVDIVYVSTIHHLHHEHAMLCLEAGKNVLVEKPLALTHEHAKELAAAARKRNLFLMEGMWTRFFPATEHARTALAEGSIGKPRVLQSTFSDRCCEVHWPAALPLHSNSSIVFAMS